MTRIPGALLATLAGFAAVALTTTEAMASSLGTRFPALRQEIQDRVNAIPAEGATSLEAKERKRLLAALVHFDVDSPTLDTDLAYTIKALTQLKKANTLIYNGSNVLNLTISLRDDVGEVWDEIPYYPRWLSGVRMNRFEQVIQYFHGSGTLEGDFLKACKWYLKALKQVRKRDAWAAKELVPGKKDTLKIVFWSSVDGEYGTKYIGEKATVQVDAVHDTGDDTLTLHITLVKNGITRDATIVVVDPDVGNHYSASAAGTLSIDGTPCDFNQVIYDFTLSAFDIGTGLVAGSFSFFYDDTELEVNCGQAIGIFTVRAMTIQP